MSKPIRILHVLGKLDLAGAETFVMNIYRNINRSSVQFDFVVHGNDIGYYESEIEKLGGNIYRAPKYRVINSVEYRYWWKCFFEEHPIYKVIHCHVRSTANIILKVAKEKKLVTIAHSHSISNGKGIVARIKNFNQRNINQFADYKFACSERAGEWLFGDKEDFSIIKNGIPVEKFKFDITKRDYFRKSHNIENKDVYGHIGRFTKEKNHNFLIETFKNISEKNSDAILLLIGTGPLEEKTRKKIIVEGLKDKVIFLGLQKDISTFLSGIDIFIFPSLYEGLGIVLIEAQAAGLPCVVSENIPKEAMLSELITSYPIENPKDFAVYSAVTGNKIMSFKDREMYNGLIKESGYDCLDISIYLQKFYKKLALSLK
ncbi:glycosyltransferase family 1 protein [Enterococcus casseliflavus]|uniref:glycosyltransferase family 1 protein n=1 Tax=Enterococcus casseliflavus TaxID=37734 RepID=UPI001E478D61|nr:glycosyltransferase family 1 protein [Enterococcus casseliflavus]MCD4961907.1 glycosyltransferase family 1 protein [Enterococcus casseliflavus]